MGLFSAHKVGSSSSRRKWLLLGAALVLTVLVSHSSVMRLRELTGGLMTYSELEDDKSGLRNGFEQRQTDVSGEALSTNQKAQDEGQEAMVGGDDDGDEDDRDGNGENSGEDYDEDDQEEEEEEEEEEEGDDDDGGDDDDIEALADDLHADYEEEKEAESNDDSSHVKVKQESKGAENASGCEDFEVREHTDFWGDALVWGDSNLVESKDECCDMCATYEPKKKGDPTCNVWVYCGDEELCKTKYKQCWLKYLAHPSATAPANEGPTVGWTAGIRKQVGETEEEVDPNEDRSYHVVISAQGAATHWQSRVHYYWYKKIKRQCRKEGKCDMGGFTRILHTGKADELVEEMPTFVANELPAEHPHHGYIVLNRPYAFLQWIKTVKIPEKYVLMCEPDHILLKPMPNLMKGKKPAAFPFFYIEPTKENFLPITERFVGKLETVEEKSQIAPIGSSPTMMTLDDMKKVFPLWFNLSIAVHNDQEAVKEWGWVQEMYAFTLSMYKAGIRDIGLHLEMMGQPPWDSQLEKFYILHYTYGMDYTLEGKFTPGMSASPKISIYDPHELSAKRKTQMP